MEEELLETIRDVIREMRQAWFKHSQDLLAFGSAVQLDVLPTINRLERLFETYEGTGDPWDEPHEPIGEEAFENSYIGGGGSPDLENL